jgi:hypothetical protein
MFGCCEIFHCFPEISATPRYPYISQNNSTQYGGTFATSNKFQKYLNRIQRLLREIIFVLLDSAIETI